jgi:hypothetical protein
MNLALATIGLFALVGLVAGLVQLSAHHNGPVLRTVDAARPVSGGNSGSVGNQRPPESAQVWDAEIVLDPLTERELELARLDHGVESFAADVGMFRDERLLDDAGFRQQQYDRMWREGFDWYIDHINRQFDAIVADLPTTDQDPFDPAYWPPVSAAPVSAVPAPLIERLATFSPDATIQIIEERNAAPAVFSWTTREYALVGASGAVQVAQAGTATLVRERPAGPRHRRRR